MPFNEANLQTLPENPDVIIFLHGQLILEPGEDGECTVGINRCSPSHKFSLEVRERMQDPYIPDNILMRCLGKLEADVDIDLDPPTNGGVTKFVPGARSENVNHLGWLIDLAGEDFHNCEVVINGTDTEPNVVIREGVLYTAAKTDESKLRLTRKAGGKNDLPLGSVAAIVGVNIYLGGKKLKVTFTSDGEEEELTLPPEVAPPNVKHYEIRIANDPTFVDPESDVSEHDEFREYYKAVEKLIIDGNDVEDFPKFKLKTERITRPGLGSPTVPCMPIGDGT